MENKAMTDGLIQLVIALQFVEAFKTLIIGTICPPYANVWGTKQL